MAGLRSVAVQSTHIHHVQLLSDPTTSTPKAKPSSESTNSNTSLHARLQRQCRANAWLLLTLGFICCLSKLGSATAASTTDKTKSDVHLDSQRDLYIVLVSIPVLDKMLPLKHLAEELLSRGCRVGFALPENYRQWVSDLEGLEFISLGNIAGKGRADYLEPNELQTLGVLAAGIYPGTIFQLYYARKIVVEATTSVMERCLNSYYRLRFRLELVSVYKEINAVRHEHGLEAIDSKHQMHGHALVLVNSVFGLDEALDEVLAVAEFGSSHLLPKRNLQPLYKTYLVDVYLIYGAILCGAAIILRTFVSVMLSVFQPLTPVELALAAEEIGASPEEVQESHTALSDSCGGTVARR
ncbi:hypothetical protein BBJ29_001810 [Phytophthora kernoviae]|uniref:Uncharacterized protein n=1 Tax=Phytophthora kernoviae TaxID=325452 RepID=A0A3F2RQR6_9STRA|nr:hypothetical protein BBJ29_001810 [Phytophthora kernoviae]RLN62395.1 hypothetical protein BBP00_00004795 [Phytophthora kernoviae]